MAFVAYWMVTPLFYQAIVGHPLFIPSTNPPQMRPHDEVAVSTAAPLLGLITLIVGNVLWRRRPFERLGFTFRRLWRSGWWQSAIAAALILPAMFGVIFLTEKFWNMIHYSHPAEHDLLRILGNEPNVAIRATVVISAVLLAPLFEEFFFRGMLQTAVRKLIQGRSERPGWGVRWLAIIIVSIAFATVHIPFGQGHGELWMVPPIFFLSLCLGLAYEITRNLWVSIIVHGAFNSASIVMFLATRHG